jgi:hypothetical protein
VPEPAVVGAPRVQRVRRPQHGPVAFDRLNLAGDRRHDPVADADRILDFSRSQGDKIDLSGIDATAQAGDGNTAFQFIGQKQFTAVGQVRWFQQGGDTIVEANTTNATAGAELRIVLDPLVGLQATDFIL